MTGIRSMEIGRSPLSKVPIFVMESGSLLIIRSRIFIVMFFKTLVKITSVNSVDCINSLEDFSINDCRAVIIYGVTQVKVSFPGRRTFHLH